MLFFHKIFCDLVLRLQFAILCAYCDLPLNLWVVGEVWLRNIEGIEKEREFKLRQDMTVYRGLKTTATEDELLRLTL